MTIEFGEELGLLDVDLTGLEIGALVKQYPVEVRSHFLQDVEAGGVDDGVRIAHGDSVERGLGECCRPRRSRQQVAQDFRWDLRVS